MVSLHRLQHRNLGFQTANRTILMIDPQDAGYRPDQLDTLHQQLHDTLGDSGVSRVAWSMESLGWKKPQRENLCRRSSRAAARVAG